MVETEPQVTELAGELQQVLSKVFSVLRRGDTNRATAEGTADLTLAQLSILLTLLDKGPIRIGPCRPNVRVLEQTQSPLL